MTTLARPVSLAMTPKSSTPAAAGAPIAGAPVPPVPSAVDARDLAVAGKSVYLIGIGGCGMAGLARMLRARGARVSGSDSTPQDTTDALAAEGIEVGFDQSQAWLPPQCDLVVASAAIKPDHPQILAAERRGLPHLTYAEALGRSMVGRTGVAIAGTHGKSTTTSMLSCVLSDAGLEPTAIVGATCAQLAGSAAAPGAPGLGFRLGRETIAAGPLHGTPGVILAEACEFNRSFHNFHPTIACINSVEADHLDIYGTLDAVVESFHHFAELIEPKSRGGYLLIAHDGAHRREVTAGIGAEVETIGYSPQADWCVRFDAAARRVDLHRRGAKQALTWTTNMPGAHNAMNSATAAVIALRLGADPREIERSLSAFRGLDRRAQFLGARPVAGGSVRVYDDYGHHPTEIDSTLKALRQFEAPEQRGGRLICVFQPHQHSRTRHLMDEFVAAFSAADIVIVPQIYFVRDSVEEKQKVTAADLVDRLRARGVHAMHLYPFEAIIEQLGTMARAGDLVVVMGAGPVWQVGKGYLSSAGDKTETR
ncbi:UDP-N-acetylmuramate--L-alanine ligase [soil metagenome]